MAKTINKMKAANSMKATAQPRGIAKKTKANKVQVPTEDPEDGSNIVSWYKDNKQHDETKYKNELSSIQVLMQWITTGDNCESYRGKKKSRNTVLSEIVQYFKDHGIHHRNSKMIGSKLRIMFNSYKIARDYMRQSGQGVLDRLDEDELKIKDHPDIKSVNSMCCRNIIY